MISLKQELGVNFIIGGATLSLIAYLVKYVKPEIGSIVWAAPIILVPTIIMLWLTNTNKVKIANFVGSSIPNVLLIVLWQISFIILLVELKKGVICSIVVSLLIWILVVMLLYKTGLYSYFQLEL